MREELEKHLALLKRSGIITVWHDRKINPGEDWNSAIDKHLIEADLVLFLVSADFLSSDYCNTIEVCKALERHHAGAARVIPVILHDCDWTFSPFASLQALPRDAKPISSWSNQHEAFADVARGIRRAAASLRATPSGTVAVTGPPAPTRTDEPTRQSSASLRYVNDEVTIAHDNAGCFYNVEFRKRIRNMSDRPRQHFYARLAVCAVPDVREIADAYYRDHPLSLTQVGFYARDFHGHTLDFHVLHQYPSNIELNILFRDAHSGERFPIYKNQEIEILYGCRIPETQWGPFLRRHVRVPIDNLSVRLSFLQGTATVWGKEELGGHANPLPHPIQRTAIDSSDIHSWSTSLPELDTVFEFRWAFLDGRDRLLQERALNSYARKDQLG